MSDATLLETPLGHLRVDASVRRQLSLGAHACPISHALFVPMTRETDEDEHSIEMHLPYVKVCVCVCVCVFVSSCFHTVVSAHCTLHTV